MSYIEPVSNRGAAVVLTFLIEPPFCPTSGLVDQWLRLPNWMQTLSKQTWELYFTLFMLQK